MRLFENGAEIGLTREDVTNWLQVALNREIHCGTGHAEVTKMTVHPDAKYVVRLTVIEEDN